MKIFEEEVLFEEGVEGSVVICQGLH